MTLAIVLGPLFDGATPIQITITVVITAIFGCVLWIGARGNHPKLPPDDPAQPAGDPR